MFENTGHMNAETLREIRRYLLPTRMRVVGVCLIAALAVIAAMYGRKGDYLFTGLCVLFIAVLIAEYFILRRRIIRTNLARIRESYGVEDAVYTTRLEDEGVYVQNHAPGASTTIPYEAFVKLAETEHLFAIFTRSRQFLLFSKEGWDAARCSAFLSALREKPTGIRWRGRRA